MNEPDTASEAAAPPAPATPRVDFYVLDEASATARLKVACRLAEKAYLAQQSVLVWTTVLEDLRAMDDMLWTFDDRSFVPHEVLTSSMGASEAPVLLSAGTLPPEPVDVVINLGPDVPPGYEQAPRIAEIIDGDESRRRAGRARFKIYRDKGVQPVSHNIRAGQI